MTWPQWVQREWLNGQKFNISIYNSTRHQKTTEHNFSYKEEKQLKSKQYSLPHSTKKRDQNLFEFLTVFIVKITLPCNIFSWFHKQ